MVGCTAKLLSFQMLKMKNGKKERKMISEEKVARHKLSVLELAERLGNVTEACKQKGVSRTQFYEYKRRFQTHSLEVIKDLPPIHKSHPYTTPPEQVYIWLSQKRN